MKKTLEQLKLVAALLSGETTLSLATTGENGEAWVAPVFYIVDKDLTLYWLSSESSQHSQNLQRTCRAAATVYRNTDSWRKICGVQMRGATSTVTEPERRRALVRAYCERYKLGTIFRLAISQSILYAFQPEFLRYVDNAKGFGIKFELMRQPQGWILSRSIA
jgi:uncharacterized protein YhbP (UPF0306 family)